MNSFLDKVFLDNTVREWANALGIIVGIYLVAKLVQLVVLKRIRKFSERSKSTFDDVVIDVIDKAALPLVFFLAFYAGFRTLSFPSRVTQVVHVAILAITVFYVIRGISAFVRYFFLRFTKSKSSDDTQARQARGILLIVQIILWVLGILFLIDNLGYDITTMVAGLGIGGIAIALAAQTILGDLFSYLVIFFDKPFEVGDFIIIDDKMGSVEYVGIKSTKIRALSGEQLIMSNTDLTNSRIQNYKRMEKRRVVFTIGVTYETEAQKLKSIPVKIREIIESEKLTQFDRAHFFSYGDFSLNFEVVYNVLSSDYNVYMDIQQRINLAIFEYFLEQKIEFAYPTQKLFFNQATSQPVNQLTS